MSKLILWKNQQIDKLKMDIASLFSRQWPDFEAHIFFNEIANKIRIKLFETDDSLIVNVALPEIDPADLKISVTGDVLTINKKKGSDIIEKDNYFHRVERRLESFSRAIKLPCKIKVEEIEATYTMEILNIVMPKRETETDRNIKIKIK